jgi:hypothetical protein
MFVRRMKWTDIKADDPIFLQEEYFASIPVSLVYEDICHPPFLIRLDKRVEFL